MTKIFSRIVLIMLLILIASSLASAQDDPTTEPVLELVVEVISERPHDTGSYLQGLLLYEGLLYESAGQHGESNLREVDPETGEVLRSVNVPEEYFAEGLARVGDRLIQLTYHAGEAFVYDLETFEIVGGFTYEGEGWGMCYDGNYLFMTDSSQFLAIRDADTFELIFRGMVTIQGRPLSPGLLNELACVGDYIYANLWQTDYIVQIDKTDGRVTAVIDASGLLTPEETAELESSSVLNGIAYDAENDVFLITGKRWPKIFEVRFVEAETDG